jgi:hypothetical protein
MNADGQTHTVTGYPARPGYDLVTGLGTIHAPALVTALAHAAKGPVLAGEPVE